MSYLNAAGQHPRFWVHEKMIRRGARSTEVHRKFCVKKESAMTHMDRTHYKMQARTMETSSVAVISHCNQQKREEDIALVAVLKECAKQKNLLKGIQVHDTIREKGLLQNNIFIGSTLVHMYAKCGALTKAQEVFDELPIRNIVAWNALMAGYIEQGQGNRALSCFEQMRGEGLSLDSVTYLCILKACGSVGAIEAGEEIHDEIWRKGWLCKNAALGSALVDMYAKCNALTKARQVFDELPIRTVVSWTGLISGYVQRGHGEQALACLDRMKHEGLSPNAITFSCILKACGSMGAVIRGEEIHNEIARKGLLGDDNVLGTALMDMYIKCRSFAKARVVFDELPCRDIVCWNSLIAGYCQDRHAEEALCCFEQMKYEGLLPDVVTFTSLLRACGSIGASETGKEIHEEILERGFLGRHTVLRSALVDMYAKCGALKSAQRLFQDLPVQDAASWNALIVGYCQHDHAREALECYDQMNWKCFSPDAVTFACLIRACGSIGAVERGEELHAEIMRVGLFGKDNILGNALVDMYVKVGALAKAQEVFDLLPFRDLVSWTTLVTGYCQHGQGEEAVNCFDKMKHEGISPDEVTFACVLKACGNIRTADKGVQIHAVIERERLLEKFAMLGSALVDMYAKCGALAKAEEVFKKLSAQDTAAWTALIDGYCELGHGEEALDCFERMKRNIASPDAWTFACILKVCGSIGAIEKGSKIHEEIVHRGLLGEDSVLGIALVDMYAKCGALGKAQQVFSELSNHDPVAWNALMAGYCQHGYGEEALKCFDKMTQEGLSPDVATFASVLKACGSIEAAEKGQVYFDMMTTSYGIVPALEHYSCMVELFGRAGLFDQAIALIKKMPSCVHLSGWSALLSACRKRGNVKLGRLAFEHVMRLDKMCTMAYISMSNIYAAAGMQEEAEEIDALREENIR